MQLATCSYAAYKPEFGTPVRITLGSPRRPEPTGREQWLFVAELAPRGWYFKAGPARFDACFTAQLDRHGDLIEEKLGWLADRCDLPLVLLCYERRVSVSGRDCHRLLVGRWWTARHPGQEVPELDGKT
jgi:hypothetical protein